MEIILSIIIPHYNSFQSLVRLLESIKKEADGAVEILVIDDKSTQGIEELREYHKQNDFFILLENETKGKGAGVCRNIGLEASKGKWYLFADADDYYLPGWYFAVQSYFDSKSDIIFFEPTAIFEETKEPSDRVKLYHNLLNNYKSNDKRSEFNLRYGFVVPWSKLIRRKIVDDHHIRFEEIMYSNDVLFSTMCGFEAENIEVDKRTIYCVVDKKNTLIKNKSAESFYIRCGAEGRRYQYLMTKIGKSDYLRYRQGPPVGLWMIKVIIQRRYKNKDQFIKLIRKYHLPILPSMKSLFYRGKLQ